MNLVERLTDSVAVQRADLEAAGLVVAVEVGPRERDKGAAWVDLDSAERLVRLTVWDTGEAVLSVGDAATGSMITEEQWEVSSGFGVDQALGEAVEWATGRRRPTPG